MAEQPTPSPDTQPDSVPAKPRRRFRFGPLWLELSLFSLVALLGALVLLALSPQGTRQLFKLAERLSGGVLQVDTVEGTLWQRLVLGGIQVNTASLQLSLDRAELRWQPARLLSGELAIEQLALGKLAVHSQPSNEPSTVPDSLSLPLAVKIEQASLASLVVDGQTVLSQVLLHASSNGEQHQVQLISAQTPWFAGHGQLQLAGARPFKLQGQLALQGSQPKTPWQLDVQLANSLEKLHLIGKASGQLRPVGEQAEPFRADFDLYLAPLASSPWAMLQAGRLQTAGLNLQALAPELPRTALDIGLDAKPAGEAVLAQLALRNTLAGKLPEARLPLSELKAELLLNADQLRIRSLQADAAGGQLGLSGSASLTALDLTANLRQLDPRTLGGPDWPISGQLALRGTPQAPQLQAKLGDARLGLQLEAGLEGSDAQRQLRATRVVLSSGPGSLSAQGRLGLAGEQAFEFQGELAKFDPAALSKLLGQPLPAGALNAKLSARGRLGAPQQADIRLDFLPSQLNQQALAGSLRAGWRGQHVQNVALDLSLGANVLKASGAFGRPGDRLLVDFSLPDVGDFGPGFHGRLDAKLTLAGSLERPSIEGRAQANSLRMPGGFALGQANLQARLDASPSKPAASPLNLLLDVSGLAGPDVTVPSLHLEVAGTQAAHTIALRGQGSGYAQQIELLLNANGGLDAQGWRGSVQTLENGGTWPLRLNAPAQLSLRQDGGEVLGLDALAVGAKVQVRRASWQAGRFTAQGQLRDVALKEWLARLPALQKRLATDLVLAADFDLSGDQLLAGRLVVERQSGDLSLSVDDPTIKPQPLKLTAAKVALNLNGVQAGVALDLQSAAFGSATGAFYSRFERSEAGWRPARGAALEGRLNAEIPSLAWLGPLLGPTAKVEGKLSAEISAAGEIGAPRLFGRLSAQDVALRLPDAGVSWREGQLEATLDGDTAQLSTFVIKAGKGEATAAGRMSLRDAGPEGGLTVNFKQFGALTRPDRNLVVSGQTVLGVQGEALTLTGKLTADEGLIELPKGGAAKLGDDVIIKGRTDPNRVASKPTLLTLRLDLDLGQKFIFKGAGVDARMAGLVRLASSPTQPLNASGAIKVEEGRYAAYGQNLSITRGIITFQGPLDNPALDILAIRKNLPQEVGVKIVGTALAPRVTLTSEEAMPDSEKLSWLILGRGTGSSGNQGDADLLLTAADALFTAGESVSLRQQLASTFGLDDISIGRSETYSTDTDTSGNALSGRVISLGKRLSDKAYVSYEQGLDGVSSAVKLTYQLTRRVSVALSAGETSAVDVLYSWLFD
ncbi:translocation/assembly module TamB domain-containing protein [Chitinimonas taiwanensis]|uniref:Autotransporter secretion inner membrane protein TamB n=1 Tax=Chitinimonas taiwanensis DSM 18899 TaxID=1121279 RepID=A0A1K2HM05_9NEIS|nr:translocation/assembly module TamB domain-containing protein [Chitinimonas taiwanensis]SFZ77856.1 autotransporter secretion inner membrane protein TamB [Chitinimonas taiwanensis DSM 18899]